MKSLFDEDEKYTEETRRLEEEINVAFKNEMNPLIKKWVDAGFPVREICNVLRLAISEEEFLFIYGCKTNK